MATDNASNTGPVYIVAASGGIEQPYFTAFTSAAAARIHYDELAKDLRPGEYGDRVDLLRIDQSQPTKGAAIPIEVLDSTLDGD